MKEIELLIISVISIVVVVLFVLFAVVFHLLEEVKELKETDCKLYCGLGEALNFSEFNPGECLMSCLK